MVPSVMALEELGGRRKPPKVTSVMALLAEAGRQEKATQSDISDGFAWKSWEAGESHPK